DYYCCSYADTYTFVF
nr:immunoglobulin light chain junction region [Macaca mulatta]MOV72070.1 immunoglobulin light chain junction region [Macaca mulatta]MOV72092.1 immunoglobulin light chain junction region [Macaca mulatta]MOV72531.1 immunoglobulin light chain junction region [Macaca mulatta]MOV72777.1 immunoglobulin light chain junction region [Macaca mulatta]